MNNVGALALLMPVALQIARRKEVAPGRVLMPLAFSSILGGMTTLIGTPPNLVVSSFRTQGGAAAAPFAMFDFAPVGLAVAAAGILFVSLAARFLVPAREEAGLSGFDTASYLTEVVIPEGATAEGMTLAELEAALDGVEVLALVRNEIRRAAPPLSTVLHAGDILQIEAEPEALSSSLSELGLRLEEAVEPEPQARRGGGRRSKKSAEAPALLELVVLPGARLSGRSATDIALRTRFGVNLLALSRRGRRTVGRLRDTTLAPGDVLLTQGDPAAIAGFAADYGCAPLAERSLAIPDRRRLLLSVALMVGAIALAAAGIVPAAIAFAAGMLGAMATNVVPPRAVYTAIDWPVIVLLGTLLPVADAVAETGLAALIAATLLAAIPDGDVMLALAVLLVVTMTLSDVVNNAATTAMMCPIALGAARALGVSPDPFLMAVAIGASCAFLTPIGHQNNTLILGPGGFRFGDY
jgi:di/tricarboxylate transporter